MAVYDGELIAHTGIIQFPMRAGWKRVHRLVVLPDYQGLGIGVRFITETAQIIASEGPSVNLTTTTPALTFALARSPRWTLVRKGRVKSNFNTLKGAGKNHLTRAASAARATFSFDYVPGAA